MKFCNKCQCDTERNARGACKPCVNVRAAAYRVANAEKVAESSAAWEKVNGAAYRAAYRAANADKIKAKNAAWQAANPEYKAAYHLANAKKLKEKAAAYRAANPEKVAKYQAAYSLANKDKLNAKSTAWAKANPEACRIRNANRHAQKLTTGKLSKGLATKLFTEQRGLCPCCNQPLGDNYHLDHIMPLALGGANVDGNIQLLRQRCNNQKSAKHPIDFMQSRGFLL